MSPAENEDDNFWIIETILASMMMEEDTDKTLLLGVTFLVLIENMKEVGQGFFDFMETLKVLVIGYSLEICLE